MHRNKYFQSKVPLALVLLFLLNVFFLVCGELLLVYKYPAELTEVSIAQYDPAWAGSRILSNDNYSTSLNSCVAELPDGSRMLITARPHRIVFGRAKPVDIRPIDPDLQEQIFYVKNGIHTAEIAVYDGTTVDIRWGYSNNISTTYYTALGGILSALELLVYYFIKKKL